MKRWNWYDKWIFFCNIFLQLKKSRNYFEGLKIFWFSSKINHLMNWEIIVLDFQIFQKLIRHRWSQIETFASYFSRVNSNICWKIREKLFLLLKTFIVWNTKNAFKGLEVKKLFIRNQWKALMLKYSRDFKERKFARHYRFFSLAKKKR